MSCSLGNECLFMNLQVVLNMFQELSLACSLMLAAINAIVRFARYIGLKHQHSQWGSYHCPDGPSILPTCEGESAVLKAADLLSTSVCRLACLLCCAGALAAPRFSLAPAFPCRGGLAPCSLYCLSLCQARGESNGDKPVGAGLCCGPVPDSMLS